MFSAMRDGEISPSAYDTTLVARVPAIDDSTCPQLPETLEWVLQNQLEDGSWGLQSHFVTSDRLLNTLSCVLALSKWKIGHKQLKQGIEFIEKNFSTAGVESSVRFALCKKTEVAAGGKTCQCFSGDVSQCSDFVVVFNRGFARDDRLEKNWECAV
eukprot:Gb_15692 [translate_table: standard]